MGYNPAGLLELYMSVRSKVVRILVWTLVGLVIVASVLYVQASRVPDNYEPLTLSIREMENAAGQFARHTVQGFGNKVKVIKPFEWSITQNQMNGYLASMDEIAFNLPHGSKRGTVDAAMRRLGLSGPAVALSNGMVTLMIKSTKYNKVLSADVAVKFTDDKKLVFTLAGTRIGRLAVPSGLLKDKLDDLRGRLSEGRRDGVSKMLAVLFAAVDGEPISPENTWTIQSIKVGIEGVTIADGELKLKVRPIPPKRKAP